MKNKLVKLLMIAGLGVAGVACTTQPAKNDSVPWQAGNDVEAFWMDYANANGGLTWGRSASYPEYEKVKEGDTLLIELAQGSRGVCVSLSEPCQCFLRQVNHVWMLEDVASKITCKIIFSARCEYFEAKGIHHCLG